MTDVLEEATARARARVLAKEQIRRAMETVGEVERTTLLAEVLLEMGSSKPTPTKTSVEQEAAPPKEVPPSVPRPASSGAPKKQRKPTGEPQALVSRSKIFPGLTNAAVAEKIEKTVREHVTQSGNPMRLVDLAQSLGKTPREISRIVRATVQAGKIREVTTEQGAVFYR